MCSSCAEKARRLAMGLAKPIVPTPVNPQPIVVQPVAYTEEYHRQLEEEFKKHLASNT